MLENLVLTTGKGDNMGGGEIEKLNNENYFVHCWYCGTKENLLMLPHRSDGKMVGWIYSCVDCEKIAKNAKVTIKEEYGAENIKC